MSDEEQKMIWTIGLNDHITGGLEAIEAEAQKLQEKMSGAFSGIVGWTNVMDKLFGVLNHGFDKLGVSEENAERILDNLTDGFKSFTGGTTTAKDVLATLAQNLKDAGISGSNFVKFMVPATEALRTVYDPTERAADAFDAIKKRLDEIGAPTAMWKDELNDLQKQLDDFVRTGEGADDLLKNSNALFEQMVQNKSVVEELGDTVKNLTTEKERLAKASEDAARAQQAEAEAERRDLEAYRVKSDKLRKDYLRGISSRNREVALSSRMLSTQFMRLLDRFGLLPPGVSRMVGTMLSLEHSLTVVGKQSKALSGLMDLLSVRVGYAGGRVNVFTLAITKLVTAIKGLITLGGGLGGVLLAVLGGFAYAYKKFADQLEEARAKMNAIRESSITVASKHTKLLEQQFDREVRASEDAAKKIKEAAAAYEELAKAKNDVAAANSEKIVSDLEAERAAWKRENGDANADELAIGDAAYDYLIEQQKAEDLARQQAHERDLEKNRAREKYMSRSRDESEYERLKEQEDEARRAVEDFKGKRPDRLDIKTEGVMDSMSDHKYKDEGEYIEALKKYNTELKERQALVEKIKARRHSVEERLPEWNEDVRKRDEADELKNTAAETRRNAATSEQQRALEAREEAYNRAMYRYETNAQTEADNRALKLDRLDHASGRATDARKLAEAQLQLNTDDAKKAALAFAVQEKKIDEEVAQARAKLEREREDLISQTNDKLERDRINAEYDYQRTFADLLADRQKEALNAERELHRQRVDDARAERDASVAELKGDRSEAQSRLNAARSQVATAWGWYKDRGSLRDHISDVEKDQAAQRRYEKDYKSLTHGRHADEFAEAKELQRLGRYDKLEERMGEWRRKKTLSMDEEATMRVALAKDEERNAESAVANIDRTLQRIETSFEKVLTMEG